MAKAGRIILRISAIVVAAVFLLQGYQWYRWQHWDDQIPDDMYIGKPLFSPSKIYKAIIFTESGGGGLSPYCFDFVSVVPASVELTNSFKRKFHVYAAGCHSLPSSNTHDKSLTLEHAPLLNWKSDTELELTFDQRAAGIGIREFVFVSHADEGRIRITQRQRQSW